MCTKLQAVYTYLKGLRSFNEKRKLTSDVIMLGYFRQPNGFIGRFIRSSISGYPVCGETTSARRVFIEFSHSIDARAIRFSRLNEAKGVGRGLKTDENVPGIQCAWNLLFSAFCGADEEQYEKVLNIQNANLKKSHVSNAVEIRAFE